MAVQKEPTNTAEEKFNVTSVNLDSSNFTAVKVATTATVSEQYGDTESEQYSGDFIKSSEFLGDNSLFVRYGFDEDENEIFNTSDDTVAEEVEELFETPLDINSSAGKDFNLDFIDNFFSMAERNLTPEQYQQFITLMPNQIKALFLYQTDFVKKIKNIDAQDLIKNVRTQASMNINYFKLVKVEILDGYEVSSNGHAMVNNPIFRLLKEEDIISLTNITLCRITRMYNNDLKINRDILSVPLEEQYFFIEPTEEDEDEDLRAPEDEYNAEAENIFKAHLLSGNYDVIGATSNIITQHESVYLIPKSEPAGNQGTLVNTSNSGGSSGLTVPNENLTVPNENITIAPAGIGGGTSGGGTSGGGTSGGGSMGGGY